MPLRVPWWKPPAWGPIADSQAYRIAPGMCFSNEPMIVLPDQFGIRLEDHFHVTEHGAAWFTEPSPSLDAPFG